MALLHMLEHQGEIFFARRSMLQNIHSFNLSEIHKKIFYLREDNIGKSYRIIDLFQHVLLADLNNFYLSMRLTFGEQICDIAWKAADNLIEQEITHIQERKKSIFPHDMCSDLILMRSKKTSLVDQFLKDGKGNLLTPQIYPHRNISSLSSGEKIRLTTLLAYEKARTNPELQLIILDEPLAHLDKENVSLQTEMIKKIQQLPNPTAQLIITHNFVEELSNTIVISSCFNMREYKKWKSLILSRINRQFWNIGPL